MRRSQADGVLLVPAEETEGEGLHLNPKHVVLRAFLDHPRVFDAASDILALAARSSLGEFAGAEEGIEAELTETTRAAFERAMAKLLKKGTEVAFVEREAVEGGSDGILLPRGLVWR